MMMEMSSAVLYLVISIFSLKIAEFFADFLQNHVANFAKFAEFLLNLTIFWGDFPRMQQFWENPKIAHLILTSSKI